MKTLKRIIRKIKIAYNMQDPLTKIYIIGATIIVLFVTITSITNLIYY